MDAATPRSTFHAEMQHALRTRAIFLAGIGSIAVGLVLIVYGQLRYVHAGASVAGMTMTLVGAATLAATTIPIRVRLCIFSCLYIIAALVSYVAIESELILITLIIPIGVLTLGVSSTLGLVVTALLALVGLILIPPRADTLGLYPVIYAYILLHFSAFIWSATRYASDASEWSWSNYDRMRELLESEREQRVLLDEAQEDLQQANSELARVTDRLRTMNEIAEAARRAKQDFVANVSHELRTPLNMIIGFSEMIAQQPDVYDQHLPPQLLADIEVIHRNSQHLSSLVDDVLDLSQVDTGRMALTREWIDLSTVVHAAARAVQPLFVSKGLELEISIPDDLPKVFCDPVRTRQVVLNLLSNAGRFTAKGGATISARADADMIEISVTDTGPGILREELNRIFEPFEQSSLNAQHEFGGSGLGLAISRRFVEMHRGRMWAESEPGQGSTFYAQLPIYVPESEPRTSGVTRWFSPYDSYEPRQRPSRAPYIEVSPRLIILEEGDRLRRLLQRYHPSIELFSADSLSEVEHEAARLPAAAVVINDTGQYSQIQGSERLTGLEFATPVLFCRVSDQDASDALGIQGYLTKPINREKLLEAIESIGRTVRSILIVDDHTEVLQLFGRMLSGNNGQSYTLLRASNGRRALQLLRQHNPDLVLLDLIMPGMSGYDLLREKASDPSICDTPVFAISAMDTRPGGFATEFLTVRRGNGLNLSEFLGCLQALVEVLTSPGQLPDQGLPRARSD